MTAVATVGYAQDLVRAFRTLRNTYGYGINVVHGLPLLVVNLTEPVHYRTLQELEHWYSTVSMHW